MSFSTEGRMANSYLNLMATMKLLAISLIVALACLSNQAFAVTNQQDVDALEALQQAWSGTIFSWAGDPCDDAWTGVTCDSTTKTTVTKLVLPAMSITGLLPSAIGSLVNLQVLDLSYNGNLTGTLPPGLFLLRNLTQLYLQYCSFFGQIPDNLGGLTSLTYLALNHNFFSGPLPSSIGQLSQLFWFDISSNQFSDSLPSEIGQLTKAKHFHLQDNNFSGSIPTGIFNSQMAIIHLLLNNNSFTGPIPDDIANLTHLDILRLDFNSFSSIPDSFAGLTTLSAIQLDNNKIQGTLPDFGSLVKLQILDLSHNQFTAGPIPLWFSLLPHLQSLAMEAGNREGAVPAEIFSPANLTSVSLAYNSLNGTLDLSQEGPSLTEVDLQQNRISALTAGSFSGALNLKGNLYCDEDQFQSSSVCNPTSAPSSSMPPSACGCSTGLQPNPTATSGKCLCSYPVSGVLVFIALKVTLDSRVIPTLQSGFSKNIPLITNDDQVYIAVVSDVVANISIYPNIADVWDISQANLITAILSSKAILFPSIGPYEYLPFGPYTPEKTKKSGLSGSVKAAIGIGVLVLGVIIIAICVYACIQKRRADKAEEISKPFASWMTAGEDNGDAPKIKGARLFTLSEMKKATNNFSKSNEIGAGGYGKVYKGVLPSGELVAIKKAQASSQQGGAEFKNEIELLSRVHHKNLVGLAGFCFEEQMLVYEYMPNGTLRESLSGRTNVKMDWHRRVAVAHGSARGLAYLHTEADPPIIHRDVKSSNILLDEKLVAKVADFGLSKLAPDDGGTGKGHVSTQVKGTLGYLDPEYYTSQRLSEKSDVYSFGVVLLELLTGKQPIEHGKFIVREVRNALQKGGLPSFRRILDRPLADCPATDLKVFLEIALRCVEEAASSRPTMKQVAKELETLVVDSHPDTLKENEAYDFHDYEKAEPKFSKEVDSSFQYSGGYIMPVVIEPK